MNILFLSSFIIYFAIIIGIGLFTYLKQKKGGDFLLGNRTLNFWISAIATNATDMSLWLFMAYPALVYTSGMAGAWVGIGLIIGMFLNWHFIAARLRTATEKLDASTITNFFEKQSGDKTGMVTLVSAGMSLIFFLIYISAGIVAFGRVFSNIFNLDYTTCTLIGTAIVTLYTFLGGFIAVSLNNFLKGIFILIAIVAVPVIALKNIGGFSAIITAAQAQNVSLSLLPDYSFSAICAVLMGMTFGICYSGQLHILVNFMGIKNAKETVNAKYLSAAWQIIALSSATLTGLIGLAYFKAGSISAEQIFVTLTKDLFGSFWSGFILCAVLAAGIATIAIQILLSASTLAHDLYKKLVMPKATAQHLAIITRVAVILVSITAWFLALHTQNSIHQIVKCAWTGLGYSFGPLVIYCLYLKNLTPGGAVAGILVGGSAVLASSFKTTFFAGSWITYLLIDPIPFILSFVAIVVVSRVQGKKRSK